MMTYLNNRLFKLMAVWLVGIAALGSIVASANTEREWHFKVFLDNKEIGYHHFELRQNGGAEQLTTNARFDVTFLKIPVFRYRHENVEIWSNQCLQSITSSTRENNKRFRINGTATATGFQVSSGSGDNNLPACVSTFAYWNKSFLKHKQLLNSQSGEYLDVEVDYLGEQSIAVGDSYTPAQHYKLSTNELDIELWYSLNDEWLGLQSTTPKGQMLRYVIE